MKKFISNLLSLVLAFALLGSNIVSANFISNGSLSNANNSSNSMGVKLRIEYDGTHTTNITTNIETRATIRYIVRTITGEESQSPVYYARTGEMKHVTNLTVTPKN